MLSGSTKKRKLEEGARGPAKRPKKKFRKQQDYHSSSEDSDGSEAGFAPVNLDESENEDVSTNIDARTSAANGQKSRSDPTSSEESSGDESVEEDEAVDEQAQTSQRSRKSTSKRNDPEAFSTSISKILSTKLTQSARKDPLLSRSRDAAETTSSLANERLERKAKAKLRADKKEEMERGRIKDVLGLESGNAGEVAEEEKRLRKIAQRGVVKLFNAVRAAQVQAERTAKEEQKKGTVGMSNREEKVKEMSKQGFLDLISGNKAGKTVEEA